MYRSFIAQQAAVQYVYCCRSAVMRRTWPQTRHCPITLLYRSNILWL